MKKNRLGKSIKSAQQSLFSSSQVDTQNTQEPPPDIPLQALQDSVVEIKYLATSWLDEFEKQVFEGKTVDQLLNNRGYE